MPGSLWDQLVEAIVRPPRQGQSAAGGTTARPEGHNEPNVATWYNQEALGRTLCLLGHRDEYTVEQLYGGNNGVFLVNNMESCRCDFELVNQKGQKLQCSHYLPLGVQGKGGKLPCVVYCHCNSGSRRDAEEAVFHLLPNGIGVLAFDFAGSGLSDGQWVTLGAHEVDDLQVVVSHLRGSGAVSSIGLWGRSMGAVTALMYSCRDAEVAGIVLDSPFARLTDLMLEIVEQQNLPIPKVMLRLAVSMMRKSVKKKAGFDITAVAPIDLVPQSTIPAVFGHGKDDTFIPSHHSEKLQSAYGGQYKNLVMFEGDHNHPRPPFFYTSVSIFFHQQLQLDEQLIGGNPAAARALQSAPSAEGDPLSRANGSMMSLPWELRQLGSGSSGRIRGQGSAAMEQGGSDHGRQALTAADWGVVMAGDVSDDDAALAAAIEASLAATSLPPRPAAAAAAAAATCSGTTAPASAEEEEEMLRKALALSLAEASLGASCSSSIDGREASSNGRGSSAGGSSNRGSSAGGSSSTQSSSGGASSGGQHSSNNPWVAPGSTYAGAAATGTQPVFVSQSQPIPSVPHAAHPARDTASQQQLLGTALAAGQLAGSKSGGVTVADVHAGAEAAAVHKGPPAPSEQTLATSPGISAYRAHK